MKTLLATDGSEYSERAAKFLTRFNWSSQDSITVFHAIYAVPFAEDQKFHFDTLTSVKKEIAPKILDSAVDILKPVKANISVEISEFSPGEWTPDECIMKAARSSNADLIAMGARGIKGIASAFLGSVTRLVAIHTPLPVLAVRGHGMSSGPIKILLAVDGSDCSRATCEFLASVPFPDDTELTILNVVASGFSDMPERFVMEISDRIKETVASARAQDFTESERILKEARKLLEQKFRAVSMISKVGDPSTEIVQASASQNTDMIAMGCRGLRGMKGILGSVSRNVLTHAPCSVLIAKASG